MKKKWKKHWGTLIWYLPSDHELGFWMAEKNLFCRRHTAEHLLVFYILQNADNSCAKNPVYIRLNSSPSHPQWRTYYLATETQQEMSTWVDWLCHVCGLKQEEQRMYIVVHLYLLSFFYFPYTIIYNNSALEIKVKIKWRMTMKNNFYIIWPFFSVDHTFGVNLNMASYSV